MDEATTNRLVGLVKDMHTGGMSVKQIEENLSQMGIDPGDIKVIISRAGLKPSTSDVHEEVKKVKESIETGEAVKPVMEKLGEAEEHFERLHTTVGALHEKHAELETKVGGISQLQSDIREIKDLLMEMKPILSAIQRLQKDLLEVNKKVLAREIGKSE